METLEQQVSKAKQKGSPLCVMMADLDFFKKVNDTYGHLVGDLVLRHTAERIQAAVRDFDMVGRFGGEEFVIVLKNTDLALARVIAERIREEVSGTPFHAKEFNIGVTISLGIAMLREGEHMETLLERADATMYEAKKNGRNRVEVADDSGVAP
jgi:diguanylate cyclase (GGDEF)-like protein